MTEPFGAEMILGFFLDEVGSGDAHAPHACVPEHRSLGIYPLSSDIGVARIGPLADLDFERNNQTTVSI